MNTLIGKSLGNYHIIERLGQGGMAQVYKAAQIGLARYVAIKVILHREPDLPGDETFSEVERFEQEAIAVAGLHHPHIIPVYDFGREDDIYYMVMPLIEGPTLKEELATRTIENRPLTLAEISDIFNALAGAVDYAHAQGVIHRDLKPANIMFTAAGQVMLADFGIARLVEIPSHTLPGTLIGTPAYMSPEQVSGQSGDARSDIYALGVILYELVTGQVPFSISHHWDILKHLSKTVTPPSRLKPDMPAGLEIVILKALHKNPNDRYQSAGEMAQALAQLTAKAETVPVSSLLTPDINQPDAVQFDSTGTISPNFPENHQIAAGYDWGEAPDVSIFYGREAELEQLVQWTLTDRHRIVAVLGLGGLGKTTLVTRLAQQVKDQFDYVIWRSLQNAVPIEDILSECLQFLSATQQNNLAGNNHQKISQLIDVFRRQRCLLVLDNFEAVLQDGDPTGHYRPGYENYDELLRRVSETQHQSCLLLTSREKPQTIAPFEGTAAQSLALTGLDPGQTQALLKSRNLYGTDAAWAELNSRYSGNPLALKLISETIQDIFDGDIGEFLQETVSIFGGIRDVLRQQFERLSALEREIIIWLAIEREPASRTTLWDNLMGITSKQDFIAALQSLRRRALVEKSSAGFTLQNVVLEYITGHLVQTVCQEIEAFEATASATDLLINHFALLKAEAKDYVRESQTRLILKPVIDSLGVSLGHQKRAEKLTKILTSLRNSDPPSPGYAAGNLLNLLIHLQSELHQFDFSRLVIRHAYAPNVMLRDVNFAQAQLINAVFTETFGRVVSLAFSPTGELLAAGTANGEVRLWRTDTGRPLLTLKGHTNWVQSVAFSPAGKLLASGSTDQTVRVWEAQSGQCVKVFSSSTARFWSVAFSMDGSLVAGAGADHNIHLWEVAATSETPFKILAGHTGWVKSVAFSPDNKTLASGSNDHTVRVWDIHTGECRQTLSGHTHWVWSVAFSPDGRFLASGSADHTIRLWQAGQSTDECLHTFTGHTDEIYAVAFSSDSQLLASGGQDQTIRIWDVKQNIGKSLYRLSGHTAWISSVVFNPAGGVLASSSFNQIVRLWDVSRSAGRCLHTWRGYANWISAVTFNPNGHTLASGGDDKVIHIWEFDAKRRRVTLQGHTEWISSVTFSPNGRTLASAGADQTVRVWTITDVTGQLYTILRGHAGWIWSLDFSPNGRTLASGGEDETVKLWDVTDNLGQNHDTLAGHTGRVRSVSFSPNTLEGTSGELLASGSDDKTVRLWDVGAKRELHRLEGHSDWVLTVKFSPNGEILASGSADRTIRLWDVKNTQSIKVLSGHTARVRSVAFSPAGDILASGSEDQSIRLWDLHSGELLNRLVSHTDVIKSVAFSPDGAILASAGDDGTIKLWEVKTGKLLDTLQSDRPYERMNITGITGLTEAQLSTLRELGAIG
jgi:WD40 repeat protein/serine/threonine protein kinase